MEGIGMPFVQETNMLRLTKIVQLWHLLPINRYRDHICSQVISETEGLIYIRAVAEMAVMCLCDKQDYT